MEGLPILQPHGVPPPPGVQRTGSSSNWPQLVSCLGLLFKGEVVTAARREEGPDQHRQQKAPAIFQKNKTKMSSSQSQGKEKITQTVDQSRLEKSHGSRK
jgi:hypothetical protein